MSAVLRLMWKEYRVLRGFWIALAIFGLTCDGLAILLVPNPQDWLPGLFGLAGVLGACFALGAGATLFALEREESTRDLLQYLPLTSLRIFTSKVSVALSGTLLLSVALLSVGLAGLWFAFDDTTSARLAEEGTLANAAQDAAMYAIMVLQALGWSVFYSLKSARPLLAALLGAVSALACISLVHFTAERNDWFDSQWSWTVPLAHIAAAATIWLIDVRLASRWLHGRRIAAERRQKAAVAPVPLRQLLWQEWRSSRRILTVLGVLGLILPLLQWADPYSGGLGAVPAVGLVMALLGSCTFLGDQERSQFRFFAEHGVSGRTVWCSRQLFWTSSASVLLVVLLVAHLLIVPRLSTSVNFDVGRRAQVVLSWFAANIGSPGTRSYDRTIQWLTGVAGYFAWVSLAFGAGQLCSMYFRSGLLAAVFGVILAGALLAWAALMQVLSIGWWWSVAPLAAALFAATWLRCDGWILERRRVRAWLPSVLALAVPAVPVLAAVPLYRVLEIPNVDIERFRPRTQPPASAGTDDAVGHLLTACRQVPVSWGTNGGTVTTEALPEERTWLTENRTSLDAVVEASLRLPADATVAIDWQRDCHKVASILVRYGQLAESDDKLDEAWTRYRAVLEMARLVRRRSTALGEVLGDEMERAMLPQLICWGAQRGQTVERLRDAVVALQQLDVQDDLLADVVWREYQANLARLDEIQAQPQGADAIFGFAAKWAPWEFSRARRLLRYVTALDLQDAGAADTVFVAGNFPRGASSASDRARASLLSETTLLQQLTPVDGVIEARRLTLCYRRATQLALGAERWRLEHGEMPEKLDDVGQYVKPLRLDPYTNEPFLWFPWGLRLYVRSTNVSDIPPKTPFLYSPASTSLGAQESIDLKRLRRQSAGEPMSRINALMPGEGGGAPPGAAAGSFVTRGSPAGIATTPGPFTHLDGLAFPIPSPQGEDVSSAKP